jgi:hypothetical protein
MVTTDEIKQAYKAMIDSKIVLFKAGETALEAKADLKSSEVHILTSTDPKELGPNEAVRTATVRTKLRIEYEALDMAETTLREAQLAFDLARMGVECLQWQIRNECTITHGGI